MIVDQPEDLNHVERDLVNSEPAVVEEDPVPESVEETISGAAVGATDSAVEKVDELAEGESSWNRPRDCQ